MTWLAPVKYKASSAPLASIVTLPETSAGNLSRSLSLYVPGVRHSVRPAVSFATAPAMSLPGLIVLVHRTSDGVDEELPVAVGAGVKLSTGFVLVVGVTLVAADGSAVALGAAVWPVVG